MLHFIGFRTTIERVYPDELKERITFLSENPTHAIILRHFEEMYQSVNPEPQLTMQALRRVIVPELRYFHFLFFCVQRV